MQYSPNKDLQHLKWQQLRSWISFPDFRVAMDKQQTQYRLTHKWKWKMFTNVIENSKIGVSRHLDSSTDDTNGPNSWSSMEDPVVSSWKRILYGHPLAGLLWERQFEKILLWEHGWEKIPKLGVLINKPRNELFFSVHVDDIKLAGNIQNINPTDLESSHERR